MFEFWNLILKLELLLPEFVKSLQSRNFQCYVKIFKQITPGMFSLDHQNYARWLLENLTQLTNLKEVNQTLYE